MKAAVMDTFGSPLEVRDVPDPTPSNDGVVIEVRANGICRSDWHGWMGHDASIKLPHVPGHEFAGIVVEKGSLVRNWQGWQCRHCPGMESPRSKSSRDGAWGPCYRPALGRDPSGDARPPPR